MPYLSGEDKTTCDSVDVADSAQVRDEVFCDVSILGEFWALTGNELWDGRICHGASSNDVSGGASSGGASSGAASSNDVSSGEVSYGNTVCSAADDGVEPLDMCNRDEPLDDGGRSHPWLSQDPKPIRLLHRPRLIQCLDQ